MISSSWISDLPEPKLVEVVRVATVDGNTFDLKPSSYGAAAPFVKKLRGANRDAPEWLESKDGHFIRASSIIRVWDTTARVYSSV